MPCTAQGQRYSGPLPFPPPALDGAPPASVHPGWGRKRVGAPHQSITRITLALPTDPAETFVREVDENLRRDQLRDMAKSLWQVDRRRGHPVPRRGRRLSLLAEPPEASRQSPTARRCRPRSTRSASGNVKGAAAELDAAERIVERRDARHARCSAGPRWRCARTTARPRSTFTSRSRPTRACPSRIRDLATVRGTMIEFDSMKPDEVIARLQPLAEPGKPFFGSAGEMTGMAHARQGRPRRRRPAVRQDRRRQPGSRIHSQPRGPDRRLPGRRRHRLACRRSRRHSCPIGHDTSCVTLLAFTILLADGLAARGLRQAARRRVQEEGQDHGSRRARRGAGQRGRHRGRSGDGGDADDACPQRPPTTAGRSRAAMPASRSAMSRSAMSLGVAWTASIGEGSEQGRPARRRAGGRRRQGLHDRHASARSARSTRRNGGQVWSARFGEVGDNSGVALRRRRRLRRRPGLCHQRPRLCRGARCHQRRGGVDRQAGRPAARRAVGRRRRRLCDEPGQSDLFAENRRRHDQLVERRRAGNRRRVRLGRAGDRPGHGRRRLLVGRAQRLSLRKRPPGVAGRAVADLDLDQRRVAVRHRRRPGDRRRPGLCDRPGRADGRARPHLRPAHLGTELRRHLDAVGRGRLAVRGQRPGPADRGRARHRQDPLDQPAAALREDEEQDRADHLCRPGAGRRAADRRRIERRADQRRPGRRQLPEPGRPQGRRQLPAGRRQQDALPADRQRAG